MDKVGENTTLVTGTAADFNHIQDDKESENRAAEGAGTFGTVLNVGNLSFGAGMLALPYAFEQGGLIVGLLGLGVVLAWNQSCCQLLVDLGEELTARLKSDPTMPTERTTYAAVGLMAMGKPGAWLVNSSVVVTLLGAATAYLITANIMLKDTPLYAGHSLGTESATYLNTLIYMILMYPLTLARSLAPLANLSVPAILGLFGGFAVILTLGIRSYDWPPIDELLEWPALVGPKDLAGFSSFFGVAVFSFGVTLMAYDVQESMVKPKTFMNSLNISLVLIWEIYALTGGLAAIIYQQGGPLSANIMEDISSDDLAGILIRIFMCMATLFTYPLVMQPVISIVEAGVASFLGLDSTSSTVAGYGALIESGGGETPATAGKLSFVQSMVVRGFLVILTGFFATSVPMFGVVVSLLGSFSISLGSFVLPPLFHFLCFGGQLGYWATTYDLLLFTVGTLTCVITTTITALSLVQ